MPNIARSLHPNAAHFFVLLHAIPPLHMVIANCPLSQGLPRSPSSVVVHRYRRCPSDTLPTNSHHGAQSPVGVYMRRPLIDNAYVHASGVVWYAYLVPISDSSPHFGPFYKRRPEAGVEGDRMVQVLCRRIHSVKPSTYTLSEQCVRTPEIHHDTSSSANR